MPPTNPASRVVVVDDVAPPELTIVAWPLRDEPLAASAVMLLALAFSIAAGVIAGSLAMGLASAIALMLALRSWWLPAGFQLNDLGVKRTILGRSRRISWRQISGYELRDGGVVLYVDADPPPLALLRQVYVPFLAQRSTVVAMVEHHMPGGVVRQSRPDS